MRDAGLTIREPTMEDMEAALTLLEVLSQVDRERRREIFRELSASPHYSSFVAVEDGKVVGFVDLWEMPDLVHGAHLGYVMSLVVQAGRWGEGIGSALLERVLEVAREKGLAELHVATEKGNERARKLYDRLGFTTESVLLEWDGEGGEDSH
jgi:ribosomal protein S18 acetylase RimI-like enzyme